MAIKKHSLVTVAARHPIPQLSYADAANRIAGTNEQSGITISSTNVHSVAHQRDNDSFWILIDDSPITWAQMVTGGGSATLTDLTLTGDLIFSGGGEINTTAPNNIFLVPGTGGITQVGAGSTSHALTTNDDLFVAGKLEVDGAVFFDSASTIAGSMTFATNIDTFWASSSIRWSSNNSPNTTVFGLSSTSNALLFCRSDGRAFNYAHAQQSNPTLFLQSNNQSTTEWGSLTHDQTDFVLDQGTGSTKLAGSVKHNITTVNAATYDLAVTDYFLKVTYTTTGAVTALRLMSAQTLSGRTIHIKDAGFNAATNNITVTTEGSETIDGSATYVLSSDGESVSLISDGTNWLVF